MTDAALDPPADGRNASDPHFLHANAAKLAQSLIGLSDAQRQVLENELNQSDEDALLALRLNPKWHVPVAAAVVCDAIATFEMKNHVRRDAGEGCDRWVLHFDHYQDIERCRKTMEAAYPHAFAFAPNAVTIGGATGVCRRHQQTRRAPR